MAAMRDVLKRDAQSEYHFVAFVFPFLVQRRANRQPADDTVALRRPFLPQLSRTQEIHSKLSVCAGLSSREPVLVPLPV